jgi:hypothetical protein
MSFKRIVSTNNYQTGLPLTRSLIAIGLKIGDHNVKENINIEDTLIAGVIEGLSGDYRTLSLITNWIEIHFERINVDRLYRAIKILKDVKVKCYFSALAYLFKTDSRFNKFKSVYKGQRILLGLTNDYNFLVKKHGEDLRFEKSKLIVANHTLRDRKDDILSVQQLSNHHTTYYYRLLIGPSYRADMIAQLSLDPNLTATELAQKTYGSFATAWDVLQDFKYLNLKSG